MRRKKAWRPRCELESLEPRVCLALEVALDGNWLAISGETIGPVEVKVEQMPVESGTAPAFVISHNGDEVGPPIFLNEASAGVQLQLGDSSDQVTVDLGGESVSKIYADLGRGDNSLTLVNGEVTESLTVRGGDQADKVRVPGSAAVNGVLHLALGGGSNLAELAGAIGLVVVEPQGGSGTLELDTTAAVDQLFARIGQGNETATLADTMAHATQVNASDNDHPFFFAGSAQNAQAPKTIVHRPEFVAGKVSHATLFSAQRDDHTTTVETSVAAAPINPMDAGADAVDLPTSAVEPSARPRRPGGGTVAIATAAVVGGKLAAQLANGDNALSPQGVVGNNLIVVTINPKESVNIKVEGEVVDKTLIRTARPRPRDLFDRLREYFN